MEAIGSAGQALLARDDAESTEFSAGVRSGERVSDVGDERTLRWKKDELKYCDE